MGRQFDRISTISAAAAYKYLLLKKVYTIIKTPNTAATFQSHHYIPHK
jgi:hypothetical protein